MKLEKIMTLVKTVLALVAPELKKEDSTHGVKEMGEAMVGINELSVFLATRFKDGVGLDDVKALWDKLSDDDGFKEKLKAAAQGANLIPAELKDIDGGEALELAAIQLDYIPKLVEALKKEEEEVA